MKKFLKFSGLIALVLVAVSFILMMATPALSVAGLVDTTYFGGTLGIFGGDINAMQAAYLGRTGAIPSALGLIAWILVLASMLLLAAMFVLPLLKIKFLEKFAKIFNIALAAALVVAAIFMFCIVPSFFGANGADVPSNTSIGAGWVIAGIFNILAACLCALKLFAKK